MKVPDITIQTRRLHLRKLEPTDADAIFELFSDPDVTRYWSSPAMTDISEAVSFIGETIAGFRDGSLLEWGIVESETGLVIGTCAYASWDKSHRRAEIGFALRRDRWGEGYMKELLGAFIPYGFEELNLHRIEADVDPRNQPSVRLLEHYGFKKEGYMRERYILNGERQDAVYYALLAHEYSR